MGGSRKVALAAAVVFVCSFACVPSASARDIAVTSFDGTKIWAHFYPATKPGAKAPTVLSGHGWGGTGATNIRGGTGFGTAGNIDIGDLHRQGYNVLTWDARGFGRSGGEAHVDGPDFEARDVMALIDYVAKQPEAKLDGTGDPRVGMTGSSYGGGIQLTTAAMDKRIDVIVPDIAWNDLTTSLFKDTSVKFGWGLLLGAGGLSALGNGIIPGTFSPIGTQLGSYWGNIIRGLAVGALTGNVLEEDRAWFKSRGPGKMVEGIRIPTLLTQGTIDTLFTLQESVENFRILKRNGVPVKLMWHCGGHGICDFPKGQPGVVEKAVMAWIRRYLAEDETVNTGPTFEWVDDRGKWHGSGAYPLADRGSLDLGGPRNGALPLSPLALSGSPIEATQSSPSLDFNFRAPSGAVQLVGAPRVTFTYTGGALPAKTFVYAQIIDRANGQVLGNQVTPIPVVLDGKPHTITRPLEMIAAHAGPSSKLALQIIGGTPLYGPQRSLSGVRFDSVHATLPIGAPVTGRGGQAALRIGTIGKPRARHGAPRRRHEEVPGVCPRRARPLDLGGGQEPPRQGRRPRQELRHQRLPQPGGAWLEARGAREVHPRRCRARRVEPARARDQELPPALGRAVSAEHIALVRRGLEAINAGDIEAVLELMHPDVVLAPSLVGGVEGTVFHGREGYRQWWGENVEIYDETSFEVTDIRANEDAVAALYTVHVRGGQSGVALQQAAGTAFWFEDGLVIRQHGFRSPAEALAAIGLEP